jgi:hypothetical protein
VLEQTLDQGCRGCLLTAIFAFVSPNDTLILICQVPRNILTNTVPTLIISQKLVFHCGYSHVIRSLIVA